MSFRGLNFINSPEFSIDRLQRTLHSIDASIFQQIEHKIKAGGSIRAVLGECLKEHLSREHIQSLYCVRGDKLALKSILIQSQEHLVQAQQEIQHIKVLQGSKYVLPLLGASIQPWKSSQIVYLLTPIYPQSLHHHLMNGPALEERVVCEIFQRWCLGIQSFHDKGLRHGDIKPGNLLLGSPSDSPFPVIADMGSTCRAIEIPDSIEVAKEIQMKAEMESTAAFRAPELHQVVTSDVISEKADVWSLGCSLYCMLYGPFGPFESSAQGVQTYCIMTGQFKVPDQPVISDVLLSLMKKMLLVDPKERIALPQVLHTLQEMQYYEKPPLEFADFAKDDGIREVSPTSSATVHFIRPSMTKTLVIGMIRCRKCNTLVRENIDAVELHTNKCS